MTALESLAVLSPHPAVLTIAEGQTEMASLPLVMAELGIKRTDSYIRILNAHSESAQHSLLATYAALPTPGPVDQGSADFLRPPTRYFIAVDGDHTYRTQQARDLERDRLVGRLAEELTPEYDTPLARDDLRSLVLIEAWPDGLDFERAHFTDRELAEAILAIGTPPSGVSAADVEARLAAQRQSALAGQARGLEAIWHGWPHKPSKVALALHLWPTLRTRIRRKRSRAGLDRIPVARVLLLARDLAERPCSVEQWQADSYSAVWAVSAVGTCVQSPFARGVQFGVGSRHHLVETRRIEGAPEWLTSWASARGKGAVPSCCTTARWSWTSSS